MKSTVKNIVVGVLAIAVIGFCGLKFWTFFTTDTRDRRGYTPQGVNQEPAPLVDPVAVKEWRVYCAPVLVSKESPDLGRFDIKANPLDPSRSWRDRNDPVPELSPAVQVCVETLVETTAERGNRPWPGLKEMQVQRAEHRNGPYDTVVTVTRQQLDEVRSGEQQHRIGLLDRGARAGRQAFYKVRMVCEKPSQSAESGVCSTWVLPRPKGSVTKLERDRVDVEWSVPPLPDRAFASPPTVYVTLYRFGIPLRWEPGRSRFTVLDCYDSLQGSGSYPIGRASSVGRTLYLSYAGRLQRTEWSQVEGEFEVASSMGVVVPLTDSSRRPCRFDSVDGPGLFPEATGGSVHILSDGWGPIHVGSASHVTPLLPYGPERQTASNYSLGIGYGRVVPFEASFSHKGKTKTLRTEVYSPAHLDLVRTFAEDRQVRVTWTPPQPEAENWAREPKVVIQRARIHADIKKLDHALRRDEFREVARVSPRSGEFIDTRVKNGVLYGYTVHLEGLARAKPHGGATGPYDTYIPVCAGGNRSGHLRVLAAEPHVARPLRVSVVGSAGTTLKRAMATQLETALGRQRWVSIVERRLVDTFLEEKRVAGTMGNEGAAGNGQDGPGVKAIADIMLYCRTRMKQGMPYFDVWVKDYRNQLEFRIATQPQAEMVLETFAMEVVASLKADYARTFDSMEQAPAELAPGTSPFSVAILEFSLAAGSDMPQLTGREITEVVEASLSEHDHVTVVERAWLETILEEMGTVAMSNEEKALKLGQVARADVIVTGTFAVQGAVLRIHARALDIASGRQIGAVDVAGLVDGLLEVAAECAGKLAAVSVRDMDGPANATFTKLELEAGDMHRFGGDRARRELFINGPSPKLLLRVARDCADERPENALAYYKEVMSAKESTASQVVSGCFGADRVLKKLGRLEERVRLWQDVMRREGLEDKHRPRCAVAMAKAQWDAGNHDGAAETFRTYDIEEGDYSILFLREKLGLSENPLADYTAKHWLVNSSRNLGAGFGDRALTCHYAAAIRLLRDADSATRAPTLKKIVLDLREYRPYQTRKALLELGKQETLSGPLLCAGASAAAVIGDRERVKQWAGATADMIPENGQDVYAFKQAATVLTREGFRDEAVQIAKAALRSDATSDALRRVIRKLMDAQADDASDREEKTTASSASDAVAAFMASGYGRKLEQDVCLVDEYGRLLRINPRTRRVIWSFDLGLRNIDEKDLKTSQSRLLLMQKLENAMWVTQSAVLVSNILDGVLYAVDPRTGKERWRYVGWGAVSAPIAVPEHDSVCVANGFGDLLVLSIRTGKVLHRVAAPADFEADYFEGPPDLAVLYTHDGQPWEFVQFAVGHRPTPRDPGSLRREFWPVGQVWIHRFSLINWKASPCDPLEELSPYEKRNAIILDRTQPEEHRYQHIHHLTLGWHNNPGHAGALKKLIADDSESPRLRGVALSALGRCNAPEAMPVVQDILRVPNHPLRGGVASSISNFKRDRDDPPPPDRLAVELGALLEVSDPEIREAAKISLARLFGTRARPWLRKTLADPSDPARQSVAQLLGEAGDRGVIPILREYLDHQKGVLDQRKLVQVLSRLGDPTARTMLIRSLNTEEIPRNLRSSDEQVVRKAMLDAGTALKTISLYAPDPSLIPFLMALRRENKDALGPGTTGALYSIGTPEASEKLITILAETLREARMDTDGDGIVGLLSAMSGRSYGKDVPRWVAWYESQK